LPPSPGKKNPIPKGGKKGGGEKKGPAALHQKVRQLARGGGLLSLTEEVYLPLPLKRGGEVRALFRRSTIHSVRRKRVNQTLPGKRGEKKIVTVISRAGSHRLMGGGEKRRSLYPSGRKKSWRGEKVCGLTQNEEGEKSTKCERFGGGEKKGQQEGASSFKNFSKKSPFGKKGKKGKR